MACDCGSGGCGRHSSFDVGDIDWTAAVEEYERVDGIIDPQIATRRIMFAGLGMKREIQEIVNSDRELLDMLANARELVDTTTSDNGGGG